MMKIATLGAGRMGRGIAVVFAFAGHDVTMVDFKPRTPQEFQKVAAEAMDEVRSTLGILVRIGLLREQDAPIIATRVSVAPHGQAGPVFAAAGLIMEGLPEILALKRTALAEVSRLAGPEPIIASTTSSILVDDMADAVEHPGRFLNAHWLNPAFLVPLVELSPGRLTAPSTTARLKALLDGVGKVPVICAATPGYIVPRMQGIVMNEAARIVEDGVASVEDVEKAVKYGFGFRFAVLGVLEFIDWGGGDILYHTSKYLTEALGDTRYSSPSIIERNMHEGRIGMKTGKGFLDYEGVDLDAYREERLSAFAQSLHRMGLVKPPKL